MTIELVFSYLKARGREQATEAQLKALDAHLDLPHLQLLVARGKLKRGVQGYWLPRPCDPGFLAVVDCIAMTADRDEPWPDSAGLACVDTRTAGAGRLTGRFG